MNTGLGVFSQGYANQYAYENPRFDSTFLIPRKYDQKKHPGIHYKKENLQMRLFSAMNNRYDLWHSLHQLPSLRPAKSAKWLLTIHDLNFLIEKKPAKAAKYLKRLQRNVDRADGLVVISDFTGALLKKHVHLGGVQVKTIYQGVHVTPYEPISEPFPFYSGEPFFFCIAHLTEKKNFHVLVPMMKFFKDVHLIIAGPDHTPYAQSIRKLVQSEALEKRVHLTGAVSPAQKSWLLHHCQAFFFPSLAEGFGIPVIEAMNFGKPVFLSKETCLPEIGSNYAYYFDSFAADYMASVVQNGLNDYAGTPSRKTEIEQYAKKFSWDHCLKQYLQVYEQLLQDKPII